MAQQRAVEAQLRAVAAPYAAEHGVDDDALPLCSIWLSNGLDLAPAMSGINKRKSWNAWMASLPDTAKYTVTVTTEHDLLQWRRSVKDKDKPTVDPEGDDEPFEGD